MSLSIDDTELIHSGLLLPPTAIAYHISELLDSQFSRKAMLEGEIGPLDIEEYAGAGLCTLRQLDRPYGQRLSHWLGPGNGVGDRGHNVWYEITWEGHTIDALMMSWPSPSHGEDSHTYLLANERDVLVRFVDAVCTWNTELRDEVLVFESGHWHKDEALFWSIKNATLDNLVLRGSLKEDIHSDLAGFFANRETYEAYGVPWKRGILFLGPPGNDGILTLATTNHPERLDPAIIDRPSRFDRKYPFDLPAADERARYIAMWNETLRPELRLPDEALPDIAERTEAFSFAYLKELFISATMRWINAPEPGTMGRVMGEQADVLKDQMASAILLDGGEEDGEEGTDDGAFMMMHHAMRGRRRGGFGVRSYWSSEL